MRLISEIYSSDLFWKIPHCCENIYPFQIPHTIHLCQHLINYSVSNTSVVVSSKDYVSNVVMH